MHGAARYNITCREETLFPFFNSNLTSHDGGLWMKANRIFPVEEILFIEEVRL